MQDFKKLNVWQRARRLTKSVYELTADYPRSDEFGLKAQMRRASVSICSNIAEGCGRRGDREFRRFLDVAWGSTCELECEMVLSFDLAFITQELTDRIVEALVEIRRMLSGLISRLVVGPSHAGKSPRASHVGESARKAMAAAKADGVVGSS